MRLRALRSFFWGNLLILEGEVVEADKEAKEQLVDELGYCEVVSEKEADAK